MQSALLFTSNFQALYITIENKNRIPIPNLSFLSVSMVYDPFQPKDCPERGVRNTLFRRRPNILTTRLANLEWSTSVTRKRLRSEPVSSAQPSATHLENNSSSENRNVTVSGHRPVTYLANHQATQNTIPVELQDDKVDNADKPERVEPLTIMGGPPLVDDRVRQLVQFILFHVNSPNVEIEAKLGILMERAQEVRVIDLVPVLCETPIKQESNADVHFISDVGEELFYKFNQRLNSRVEETSKQKEGVVRYVRARELDTYFPGRVRQTKIRVNDNSPFKVIRTQRKKRLGDLNVLCPGRTCDLRYSASSEEDCAVPNAAPEMERDKDRISYKFEYLSIDITTVQMVHQGRTERSFEVEVEIDSPSRLFEEVKKYRSGDGSSKLFDIAGSLVNTVRLLLEI